MWSTNLKVLPTKTFIGVRLSFRLMSTTTLSLVAALPTFSFCSYTAGERLVITFYLFYPIHAGKVHPHLKGRTTKVHSFWKVREKLVIEGLDPESVVTLLIDKMIKNKNKKKPCKSCIMTLTRQNDSAFL